MTLFARSIFILVYLLNLQHKVFGCGLKKISCITETSYKFCFTAGNMTMEIGNMKYCRGNTTCDENYGTLPCVQKISSEALETPTRDNAVSDISEESPVNSNDESVSNDNSLDVSLSDSYISTPTVLTNALPINSNDISVSSDDSLDILLLDPYISIVSEEPPINSIDVSVSSDNSLDISLTDSYFSIPTHVPPIKSNDVSVSIDDSLDIPITDSYFSIPTEEPPINSNDVSVSSDDSLDILLTDSYFSIPTGKFTEPMDVYSYYTEDYTAAPTKPITLNSRDSIENSSPKLPNLKHQYEETTVSSTTQSPQLNKITTSIIDLPILMQKNSTSSLVLTTAADTELSSSYTNVGPLSEQNNINVLTINIYNNIGWDKTLDAAETVLSSIEPVTPSTEWKQESTSLISEENNAEGNHALNNKLFGFTTSTTEEPIAKASLPICVTPGRYPLKYCNQYYECSRIMWWFQVRIETCRSGEAFDVATSACRPNKDCQDEIRS